MIPIKEVLQMPVEQRAFLFDYLGKLNSFQFNIEHYRGKEDDLPLQNLDLWIECYIDILTELQEFREKLFCEMNRLGIEKHPDYVYDKEFNHYYDSNQRKVDRLKKSLEDERNNLQI